MFKNTSGQKFVLFAFDSTTNQPKTGDAANITAYLSKDYGSVTAITDTSATEMDATNAKGYYLVDASQAETNFDEGLVSAKSSTANIVVVGAPARITTIPNSVMKKNTALANFAFEMTDSTNHNPATGKTVTVTRSIDGGAFSATTAGTATEISNGAYEIDLSAADRNGDVITLRMVATGCDDLFVTLLMEP